MLRSSASQFKNTRLPPKRLLVAVRSTGFLDASGARRFHRTSGSRGGQQQQQLQLQSGGPHSAADSSKPSSSRRRRKSFRRHCFGSRGGFSGRAEEKAWGLNSSPTRVIRPDETA
ncbi:hypothetical protein EYF80_042818 [Liparis tanakae]|uniref:Uncharacterized protein n=1 Tax=Liparis tanakae TaxID=230148 RepID=A0A4Z2G0C0_9TELE|nr:hypothetical protein EYF80_042818 [Liparis tanakae]